MHNVWRLQPMNTRWVLGFVLIASLFIGCPSTQTAIKKSNPKTRVFDLRRQLRSVVASEREAAAIELGKMGPDAEKAISALQRTVIDNRARVRMASTRALGQIGVRAVPALLYARSTRDAEVRKAATQGIHQLADQQVSALSLALKNPLAQVRQQAAIMLGELGAKAGEAASALSHRLKDEENDVRVAAIVALRKIGEPQATTGAIILRLGRAIQANKNWWRVKVAIAQTLGHFKAKSAPAAGDLVPLLADRDKNVYRAAAAALIQIGPGAVEAFKEKFVAAPWQAKVRIAKIVTVWGPKAAAIVPVLSQGLRNSDSDVRKATIQALLKMKSSSAPAIPLLKSMLSDAQISRENWLGCLSVLLAIGAKGADTLKQLLSGQDWNLRKKIVEGLGQLGAKVGTHGVPVLVHALQHKEKEVQWIAAMVLRKLKHRSTAAVSALTQALSAKDTTTRKLAAKALGAIGFGAKSALPALKKSERDGNAAVREAAKQAIAVIEAAKQPATRETAPQAPRALP